MPLSHFPRSVRAAHLIGGQWLCCFKINDPVFLTLCFVSFFFFFFLLPLQIFFSFTFQPGFDPDGSSTAVFGSYIILEKLPSRRSNSLLPSHTKKSFCTTLRLSSSKCTCLNNKIPHQYSQEKPLLMSERLTIPLLLSLLAEDSPLRADGEHCGLQFCSICV